MATTEFSYVTSIYEFENQSTRTYHNECTNLDVKAAIHDINYRQSFRMIPVMLMMFIFMAAGAIGNLLVLLIYFPRLRRTTASLFIFLLACVDFISSVLLHPYLIDKLFYLYGQNPYVCKIFEFINHVGLTVQSTLMLCISIDRFYAISQPLKFRTSFRRAKAMSAMAFVMGIATSTPLLVFYGKFTSMIQYGQCAVKTHVCHYSDFYEHSVHKKYFSVFIFCTYVGFFLVMIMFYICIGYLIYKRNKKSRIHCFCSTNGMDSKKHATNASMSDSAIENVQNPDIEEKQNKVKSAGHIVNTLNDDQTKPQPQHKGQTSDKGISTENDQHYSNGGHITNNPNNTLNNTKTNRTANTDQDFSQKEASCSTKSELQSGLVEKLGPETIATGEKPSVCESHTTIRQQDHEQNHSDRNTTVKVESQDKASSSRTSTALAKTLKLAKILFIVTVVFFLSWLPFWINRFSRMAHPNSQPLTEAQKVIVHLMNHFFYINNMANPIIYALANKTFRQDLKKLTGRFVKRFSGI